MIFFCESNIQDILENNLTWCGFVEDVRISVGQSDEFTFEFEFVYNNCVKELLSLPIYLTKLK